MVQPIQSVGVDIGGTKTAVAAVDERCRICQFDVFVTDAGAGFEPFLDRLSECILRLVSAASWESDAICGIGIGCAGPLDPASGVIHNPYTLPGWAGVDIRTPLSDRFRVPVVLENDADAAAVGEAAVGAGFGADPLLMLTLGTGVGGGCLVNQRIYRGCRGEHPEFGHLLVEPSGSGPVCYCGSRGCLESLVSGTAIADAGKAFGFRGSREVFERAAGEYPHDGAVRIVDRAVEALAVGAWTLWHTLLPERIILGGGIAEDHFPLFEGAILKRIAGATQMPRRDVTVVPAKLGNRAGVIGAACLPRAVISQEPAW